jgi:hypothetical protein
METREDLDFMFHGIMSLYRKCIEEIHTEVVPARLNSDIIENIFCQQRVLYHGATTNPTYNYFVFCCFVESLSHIFDGTASLTIKIIQNLFHFIVSISNNKFHTNII